VGRSAGGGVGRVPILRDIGSSIEDRHVLIVEDIIDTGYTLSYPTFRQFGFLSFSSALLLYYQFRKLK